MRSFRGGPNFVLEGSCLSIKFFFRSKELEVVHEQGVEMGDCFCGAD